MIKNIPNPKQYIQSKDFEFAPEYIQSVDADEYIKQINETTEYFADYCGTSKVIETTIIIDNMKYSRFTNVLY